MTIKGLISDEESHLFIRKTNDELITLRREAASLEMTKNFDYDGHASYTETFRKEIAGILELGNYEAFAGMIETMIAKVILFPDHVHIEFEWDPSLVNQALPLENTEKQNDLSRIGGEQRKSIMNKNTTEAHSCDGSPFKCPRTAIVLGAIISGALRLRAFCIASGLRIIRLSQ